jgi:hypothetical protein
MNKKQNSAFARLYLFAMKAKGTTGIYFMGFVCFYFVICAVSGNVDVSIGIWKAVQMVVACIAIGFGQAVIVPTEKLSVPRGALWLTLSSFVTIGFTLFFGWFKGFPPWSAVVFCSFLIAGLAAYLLGLIFDTRRETEKLNEHLKEYQHRLSREG